ncbi:diaminopimelate decarboxylase [Dorcoceras hygrometricum]|uniref:Diaminopimelate decarboxylase n=1 Tax=Dorcoceras hygrometricum TaxID=472368 RepID=A0A2Z7BXA5_9LAMI|nr:diaminopimelate decarboxylase [Dorcoceras hygrometricum]
MTLNSVYVVSHTVAAGVHLWSLGVLAAVGCGIGSLSALAFTFSILASHNSARTIISALTHTVQHTSTMFKNIELLQLVYSSAKSLIAHFKSAAAKFPSETGTNNWYQSSRTPQNHPPILNTLSSVSVRESRIQYLCDSQWFRDIASRGPTTIVAPESQFRTCPSDHGPFNPYIPIRSTTIGKSRVVIDPIAMHTSWRSNIDIASVTSIGYPRMSASGESSTAMHRLLHASESHPIPPPNDPKIWIHDRVALGLFKGNVNLNSSSSSSNTSSGPQIDFTDDIPEIPSSDDVPPVEETTIVIPHISLPTVVPSTDYTEAFAQIRATVDKISLEQFQTRFHIDELKANLSKKISNLETAFHTASDNQDRVVLVQNNVLRKEMQVQKAALGKIAAVEVCSLLTIVADLDLEIVEEVEAAAVNRQGKEEVDIEEEEVQVLGDGIVGSVEKFFVFSSLYKYLVLSQL